MPINADEFKQRGLKDIDFELTEEIFNDKQVPYYSVSIKSLYHEKQENITRKNKIVNLSIAKTYELFNIFF